MTIEFDGQVAIVTGAGNGLGRAHALALAKRGARILVNDLGGSVDGSGNSTNAAEAVVAEIKAEGGEAIASTANVTASDEVEAMVANAMHAWGRVDILVNNAGILRDRSFSKMSVEDFRAVLNVHLMGSVVCTKAVWDIMRQQSYGRIVMTVSASGLYGSFGQSNYGSAKMGIVGLMNTLHLEGAKYDIRVNALAPAAATRMTENVVPEEDLAVLTSDAVTPALLYLASREAPSRLILNAGAGAYSATKVVETEGIYLLPQDQTPENIAANAERLQAEDGYMVPGEAHRQVARFVHMALKSAETL